MYKPILERGMIIQVSPKDIFSISNFHWCPDPLKHDFWHFFNGFCPYLGVWALVKLQYSKDIDCVYWGNHPSFQIGLIYPFIKFSYLTIKEMVMVKCGKIAKIHTKSLSRKTALLTRQRCFRSRYLGSSFLISCTTRS